MSRWIVCGVAPGKDESSTLQVASHLSARIGARLAIVTVVVDPREPELLDAYLAEGSRTLAEATRKCRVADDVVHRVEFGDAPRALARAAAHFDAEMIVVGATRRSPLVSLVAGNLPERLVENSQRPVVVVPEEGARKFRGHSYFGGSLIAGVATDGNADLVGYTASLARQLGVRPLLVTATNNEVVATMAGGTAEPVVRTGEPVDTLESVAEDRHACAIVVASRGHGRIRRALKGSVTRRLTRTSTRPVVVLPFADERPSHHADGG